LSTVYLIRHGQAGTRDSYDSLSELGLRQARLLGEYFVSQKLAFHAVITGSLNRQQQTAQAVAHAYASANVSLPPIVVDPTWDEFDLTRVYREIAPQLCAEDKDFASEYSAMKNQIRASAGSPSDRIHREWHPCDAKVVQAWMNGRYREEGETWQQFHERIASRVARLRQYTANQLIAIFTSATPIGIWGGLAMDIFDQRSIRLAGVVQNSSFTIFRLRPESLSLFTFNTTPHLADPALRTHR
jgi:broad specificity phosphatase PhoE